MFERNNRMTLPERLLKQIMPGVLWLILTVLLFGCTPVEASSSLPAAQVALTSQSEQPLGEPVVKVTRTVTTSPEQVLADLPTATSTATLLPSPTTAPPTPTPDYSPTPDIRPLPQDWRTWPVIPAVSHRAVEIYQQGLAQGNDPHVFSIIGDCQSEPPVFMGLYDSNRYYLGEGYPYLQDTIDQFAGNFDRVHATVKNGLSVASVFSPLWAPADICQPGETPLDCEFRLYSPSLVFINLGTNWKGGNGGGHEVRLREVVEYVISKGAVPILSTKADNHEGDHSINLTTAQVAYDYDIPLWNFWASVQDLSGKGLDFTRSDDNYLTVEAWGARSFTGLITLDRVWRTVNGMEIP
jgi:hypothetical protein